jgi:RNase P subunit RPR2
MVSTGQLFRCRQCNHVDMVDLAASEALREGRCPKRFLCTKCLTGAWHNQFPYAVYAPSTDDVINPPPPQNCT